MPGQTGTRGPADVGGHPTSEPAPGDAGGRASRGARGSRARPTGVVRVLVATVLAGLAIALVTSAYPRLTPAQLTSLVVGGALLLLAAIGGAMAATTDVQEGRFADGGEEDPDDTGGARITGGPDWTDGPR